MTNKSIKRTRLVADDGMVLTNGEIFGTEIFLAEGEIGDAFWQIPFQEYEKIVESNAERAEKLLS